MLGARQHWRQNSHYYTPIQRHHHIMLFWFFKTHICPCAARGDHADEEERLWENRSSARRPDCRTATHGRRHCSSTLFLYMYLLSLPAWRARPRRVYVAPWSHRSSAENVHGSPTPHTPSGQAAEPMRAIYTPPPPPVRCPTPCVVYFLSSDDGGRVWCL